MTTTAPEQTRERAEINGLGDAVRAYVDRIRGGELGSLPAVLGLVALVIFFTALEGTTFFSRVNFANLLTQGAMVMVIAMGLVFVLLLGEIDLAAGFTAGTCAAILGKTLTEQGWPLPLALAACILTGVAIGLGTGLLVARLGIPSFVVTLATFLALQGAILLIIGDGGTIGVDNDFIYAIENKNLPPVLGWLLAIVIVGAYGLLTGLRRRSRAAVGLAAEAFSVWAVKLGTLVVLTGLATYFLNQERGRRASIQGVPYIVPVVLVLFVGLTFLLSRTNFGRHVYAVGGNVEAARRAGINVKRISIICFVICSTLAAIAGIIFASKDGSVSPTTGGTTTLLLAVGAAVIGGTSLFGGRGRIIDAVVGGLVVAVILNGLPLIDDGAGIQYVITGLVLLLAAGVDALSRRRAPTR
jgi:D-xylose transport system permease protein